MKKPIGIDLGTTNCCIAWMEDDCTHVYQDDAGRTTVPSIVAQTGSGEVLVGWRAKAAKKVACRHGFAKRALGSTQRFPWRDGDLSAWQISALILKELKRCAEQALGSEVAAVVTVPAHFQEIHREETRRAAQEAGLELIDLLQEPIAAAIAYYHEAERAEQSPAEEAIQVYDLGGGTMDATVCVRRGEHVEVGAQGRAYDGDKFLGGIDFDKALVSLAAEQLKKQGLPVSTLGEDLPTSQWLWELLTSAERCKQDLSRDMEVQWTQELVMQDSAASLNLWVPRRKFEEAIRHLVDRTLVFCDHALLTYAGYCGPSNDQAETEALRQAARRLSKVILVGGSTLVPCVRDRIQAHYQALGAGEVEMRTFRPYECVAIGAAIYAASRRSAPETRAEDWLSWDCGPRARVGQEVELHPELVGRVLVANSDGWVVNVHSGSQTIRVPVKAAGRLRIPPLALTPGENSVALELVDNEGSARANRSYTILRGGISISEPGLAHPISIRLVEGLRELVPAGTRSGSSCKTEFYVNEKTAQARAPLYEGHSPIGTLQFAADAEPGTPVGFRTLYRQGRLEVEVQIGDRKAEKSEICLESTQYTADRTALLGTFQELSHRAEFLLGKLPEGSALRRALEREWQALRLDLETEFANPLVLDLNRIDDRLRQLEILILRLQGFAATPDGLRQRLEGVRQQVREGGADRELLRELDEIEGRIPKGDDNELIATLDNRLQAVMRSFYMSHPPEISPDLIQYIARQLRSRLESIRRDAAGDAAVVEKANRIEENIGRLLSAEADDRLVFNRLLLYEHEIVDPLFQSVVIHRSQEGLLRGTPR